MSWQAVALILGLVFLLVFLFGIIVLAAYGSTKNQLGISHLQLQAKLFDRSRSDPSEPPMMKFPSIEALNEFVKSMSERRGGGVSE